MTYGGQGGMTDKTHSEETKNKMKLARNKRHVEPMLGKKHSDVSKNKMSESRKSNPDRFMQASIAGKISAEKRKNNLEYTLKQSEKMKEIWASRKALGT